MKPYYQDLHNTLYNMNFLDNDLSDESVQMVVTSPPYWGLRKYAGEQELIWGDKLCGHEWVCSVVTRVTGGGDRPPDTKWKTGPKRDQPSSNDTCSLCGAWRGSYGLEPTPELYVQHTVEILREIRRVLRKDGVVFWNIGDSYCGYWGDKKALAENRPSLADGHGFSMNSRPKYEQFRSSGLKPKDLCLIPFRVAIAAQEDGWWVRSSIIWSKPNPMPESVTDRPTESHEYILMLTKSARYYWDQDAVREKLSPLTLADSRNDSGRHTYGESKWEDTEDKPSWYRGKTFVNPEAGRNLRSVWTFPTQPYPEAHFAVFPEKLPELCIKAATPEAGCCAKCGAPWERIKEPDIGGTKGHSWHPHKDDLGEGNVKHQTGKEYETYKRGGTIGWQPTCKCNADKVPSIVLDPFQGAGTTLWVAKKLNRKAIGFEISEEYCKLTVNRIRQQIML